MREVIIKVRDDLDGSDAIETIQFAVRGITYEIDLSTANVELFEKSMQQFIDAARRVQATQKTNATAKVPANRELKRRRQEIRDWAVANGFPDVMRSRRLPYNVLDAYQLAHPEVVLPPQIQPQRASDKPPGRVLAPPALESVTAQQLFALGGEVHDEGVSAHKVLKTKTKAQKGNQQRLAAATMAQRRAEKFGDKLESLDKDRRNEIRTWANDNGFHQSMTGHIKDEVLTAYFDAHPGDN
jgi:hypothetical protein